MLAAFLCAFSLWISGCGQKKTAPFGAALNQIDVIRRLPSIFQNILCLFDLLHRCGYLFPQANNLPLCLFYVLVFRCVVVSVLRRVHQYVKIVERFLRRLNLPRRLRLFRRLFSLPLLLFAPLRRYDERRRAVVALSAFALYSGQLAEQSRQNPQREK